MQRKFLITLLLVVFGYVNAQDLNEVKNELEYSLKNELLDMWYPRTIDTLYGGFLCDFTYNWKAKGPQQKMVVTQARHLWTLSLASMFLQDTSYQHIAKHAYEFLRDYMWDNEYGGFWQLLNRKGKVFPDTKSTGKTAYGNAFTLYALSSYYKLSGDTLVLHLAKKNFLWLERFSHDPLQGGYFDRLMPDGSTHLAGNSPLQGMEREQACWKDYNSSIHLLEAFTELYKVWPDSLVRERIIEMLVLIRDTIIDEKGYMRLFFKPDWTPVSYADSTEALRKENWYYDHVSFGHDVETAYLMIEASQVLGSYEYEKTLLTAKRMVDHALAYGWDNENGGFYDRGYYYKNSDTPVITYDAKIWWTQAEGLNALLMMSFLFPDENKYRKAFIKQWKYITTYLIDHTYGEWYMEGLDKTPGAKTLPKASQWKINYHNSRALMNCIRMLEGEGFQAGE